MFVYKALRLNCRQYLVMVNTNFSISSKALLHDPIHHSAGDAFFLGEGFTPDGIQASVIPSKVRSTKQGIMGFQSGKLYFIPAQEGLRQPANKMHSRLTLVQRPGTSTVPPLHAARLVSSVFPTLDMSSRSCKREFVFICRATSFTPKGVVFPSKCNAMLLIQVSFQYSYVSAKTWLTTLILA